MLSEPDFFGPFIHLVRPFTVLYLIENLLQPISHRTLSIETASEAADEILTVEILIVQSRLSVPVVLKRLWLRCLRAQP